ncbi:AAA family ATPase [Acinetobacter sp. YH12052]|uniref:AAA family ATPase n=1 Tax=Acinetobacter sp. YH12052 TaxID=2601055 RepID=UPI0015D22620|nr:AAA family ATPase [Acinetobacter sp. YH12052]
MKIKRISKIDNFSIFKNFDWATSLTYQNNKGQSEVYDFKDINILYGRNYSGKTSLSKIIRSLEKKQLPPKYDNPDFKIKLSDNTEITQNNLQDFSHPIHVYNSDFVKAHLKFIHNEDDNIESFSVTLGGDNQQILDRIQELKDELGSNEENAKSGVYLSIQHKEKEVKDASEDHGTKKIYLEKLLTDKATRSSDSIKTQHSTFGDINYSITKLRNDIVEVQKTSFQSLTDDQETEKLALIKQNELTTPPEIPKYTLNFSSLAQATNETLKTVVNLSGKIEELTNNPTLNSWVQTGHQLHQHRETCAFCSNEISEERGQTLKQHFNQEFQLLQSRISKGIQLLDNDLDSDILKFTLDLNLYYQQYHSKLSELNSSLQSACSMQKTSLKQLKAALEQKHENPFIELESINPQDYSIEITTILNQISNIRDECNQLSSDLKTKQNEAKNALRLNHVFHFLHDINFNKQNLDINLAFQAIGPLETELTALKAQKDTMTAAINTEEDKLKSEGEACKRINEILQHDFGHQHLSLEPIETASTNGQSIKFEIQRIKNGVKTKAHNLSEGEQSLISFCYFLAKVQDDLDQSKKPIIWIDDPISSLDSNHIFFIFSLIEEKIVVDQKFGQLFISTHNLEFLKYLKRLNGKKWGNIQFFIIKRNFDTSTIVQMPNYMKNYFSELNFLFHQLHLCASEENINDQNYNVFYNFPNNARKFLELYSNFHYPDGFSNTDTEKLKSLWGEHLVFTFTDRINNEYSHLAGIFERSFTPLEQPEMNKASFAILKKIIALNPRQYEGFLKSIGIESTALDPLYIKLTS